MSEADEWKRWEGWVPGDPVPGEVPGTARASARPASPSSTAPPPPPPPPSSRWEPPTGPPRRPPSRAATAGAARRVLRLAMGALVAVVLLPLALSVVALVGLFDAAMDPDVPGAVATTEQPVSVGAWPAPGVVVDRLSAEIGRPVTHVASLVVDRRSVVAEVVWPDESPAVELWRLDHLDATASGPEPAAPLGEGRAAVALSALAVTPWSAMAEQAVATLAVGGGEVSRLEVRAGDGGRPEVAVHVVHVAGEAGVVVFDATGAVVSVRPA